MHAERRTSPRRRAYRPVRFHQPGAIPFVETLSKDLAEGGLRCLSPLPVPVATALSIEVSLSAEEPLEVRGKTAWLRSIPDSEQFELGIMFEHVNPQNQRRLSVCLERLSNLP